jgi:transcriptional regulator with XRE-family HTH domain
MGSLPTDQHPQPITRLYGEQLRAKREEMDLSQGQVAEIAGVSQKTVSRWEVGSSQPDFQSLYKLCEAFHCKPSQLVPRNQYPSAPLDPAARQLWVWRRNAQIQGARTEEEIEARVEMWRKGREDARDFKADRAGS